MNDYNTSPSLIERFGIQIALAIFFSIFLILNAIQFVGVVREHSQLSQAQAQLKREDVAKQVSDARLVANKLDTLVRELVVLSPTNANAKQILGEFHIAPAQAPAAAR